MRVVDVAADLAAWECVNGRDDDGDELADGADPGCRDGGDPSERPDCADGLDNDGDGLVDFGADPGCLSRLSDLEALACQNGLDDDGDGAFDFDGGAAANGGTPLGAADSDCPTAFRNSEQSAGCGLGAELAPLLAALAFARRRRRGPR